MENRRNQAVFVNQKKLGPLHDDVPPFTFVLGTVGEGDFFLLPTNFGKVS